MKFNDDVVKGVADGTVNHHAPFWVLTEFDGNTGNTLPYEEYVAKYYRPYLDGYIHVLDLRGLGYKV